MFWKTCVGRENKSSRLCSSRTFAVGTRRATYYSVKEGMFEAFADGDAFLGINHQAFAN